MKNKNPLVNYENFEHHMNFYHPPLLPMPDIPVCLHYGSYLSKRRFDVHTGTDLYAPVNAPVYAIEKGEVVKIRYFTGKEAGCPHWNTTWAVDIEGNSGIICYGEIDPSFTIKEGHMVGVGQSIGRVLQVLKNDKGKAMSMLHFAIHRFGWKHLYEEQQDPDKEHHYDLQIDPTPLLIQLKQKADLMINNKEAPSWTLS